MIGETINSIYQISNLIYTQVQLAKINKVKCRKLSEQVNIIVVIVKRLELVKDHEEYAPALLQLVNCLERCLKLITKFSKQQIWTRRIKNWFRAKKYKECFEDISHELASKIQVFDLALDAQQIVNREQDNVEQMTEHQKIFNGQKDEMIRINELHAQSNKIILHQFQETLHHHHTKISKQELEAKENAFQEPANKVNTEEKHVLLPEINLTLQKHEKEMEDLIMSRVCCLDCLFS